jgi:competence protein ComGC
MENVNIETKSNKLNIIFLVLMVIAICIMLFLIVTLIKNKDIITSDPLNYGMKMHNFTTCSCMDSEYTRWESNDSGFINTRTGRS